ncbi:MAG: sulfite exporter TauE/SafE family protein [Clostridiales bacterium]|jgi:uncharacterized membrane protein YfcA|nr:sulfite exporter TauE/SafE family protein [Clostridiales bacterium]
MKVMKGGVKRAIIGVCAGFMNGLFGSGGGALVVPASRKFLGMDAHKAHASAIAIMLPMSAVSAVMYSVKTKPALIPALLVSAGGVLGGWIGAKVMTRLSGNTLRKIFAAFILAAAIKSFI